MSGTDTAVILPVDRYFFKKVSRCTKLIPGYMRLLFTGSGLKSEYIIFDKS